MWFCRTIAWLHSIQSIQNTQEKTKEKNHLLSSEKIVMKSKYDRPALKLEFFQSDIDEVESFFQDKDWLKHT